MRLSSRMGVLAAVGCVAATGVLAGTGTAQAAAKCTIGGGGHGDWATCHVVPGSIVYGGAGPSNSTDGWVDTSVISGHLFQSKNWFECRIDNGPWNGGGPHPHRWLYTESDDGGWGYVADTDVYDETNTVLGCGEFA